MTKILVTVGAQMPFDRLVRAIDAWASEHPEHDVLAQIGHTGQRPAHIRSTSFLAPDDFDREYDGADVIVGHAGIGTLIAALQRAKPILVLPRESARQETRNDHQIDTAHAFERFEGIVVAWSADEIADGMERVLALGSGGHRLSERAGGPLVKRIARFLDEA